MIHELDWQQVELQIIPSGSVFFEPLEALENREAIFNLRTVDVTSFSQLECILQVEFLVDNVVELLAYLQQSQLS